MSETQEHLADCQCTVWRLLTGYSWHCIDEKGRCTMHDHDRLTVTGKDPSPVGTVPEGQQYTQLSTPTTKLTSSIEADNAMEPSTTA